MTKTSLTFADVKAFVSKDKGSDSKLIKAADLLLGTVLLLGPTVAGLPLAVISASLGLLGAKNELVKLGKSLYKWLTKSRGDDSKAREERSTSLSV